MKYISPCSTPELLKGLLRIQDKIFWPACVIHDYDYGTTHVSRYVADRKFLDTMLIACENNNRPDMVKWAYIYYYAVRLFGWRGYGKRVK